MFHVKHRYFSAFYQQVIHIQHFSTIFYLHFAVCCENFIKIRNIYNKLSTSYPHCADIIIKPGGKNRICRLHSIGQLHRCQTLILSIKAYCAAYPRATTPNQRLPARRPQAVAKHDCNKAIVTNGRKKQKTQTKTRRGVQVARAYQTMCGRSLAVGKAYPWR